MKNAFDNTSYLRCSHIKMRFFTRLFVPQASQRDEVYEALEQNYPDERIRRMLNSAPKYCGGDTVSDKWAQRITGLWFQTVRAQEMPKGRQLLPGRI